jgi:DNA polymerase sigma
MQAMSGSGEQVDHLGSMLLTFLQRFGVDFDRNSDAVAVKRGGFVKKSSLGSDFKRNGILSLEDPLTGVCCVRSCL